MTKVVIDTRFLVEYFYTKDENIKRRTKQKLKELIKSKQGIFPAVVLSEITNITCRKRGVEEAKIRYLTLLRSGLKMVPIDGAIAYEAGVLKCKYPNTPMGDCVLAATAMKYRAKVLSDNPHFDGIKEIRRIWI